MPATLVTPESGTNSGGTRGSDPLEFTDTDSYAPQPAKLQQLLYTYLDIYEEKYIRVRKRAYVIKHISKSNRYLFM